MGRWFENLSLNEYIDIKTKICYDCYIKTGKLDTYDGIGKIGIIDAIHKDSVKIIEKMCSSTIVKIKSYDIICKYFPKDICNIILSMYD